MIGCRSSLQCIVPPYMLREIVENGTPEQRQQALRNIVSAEAIRVQREVIAKEGPPESIMEAATVGLNRIIYSAENGSNLPGRQLRAEGGPPTGDPAADEAYDGAGATHSLFYDIFNRDSIDAAGMRLDSTVHFRTGYDNAFWNGQQMVYGDGDEDLPEAQRLFNRFTIAVDIIGHELAHGVTQHTANLIYQGQSGALNESMSDVFGSLVKQRLLGHTAADADWIIGEGLFTANVNGTGIRNMKAPGTAYDDPVIGKDPQPGHMRDFVQTQADNGGVHINSGIPNRAFYVTAFNLGGFAWEKAGQIWYVTLQSKLSESANFATAAAKTYEVARDLYGQGSLEQQAVRAGWLEVGIDVEQGGSDPGDGDGNGRPGCAGTLMGLFRSLMGPR
ncbi:Extracellular metalloprotease [Candidatus Promineifilum breve]|uniref:Neutral metalloproteinase n=1 Tax=Candidatus Promineifilum breve TaxID=1806508 RepID=A0A160T6Q8_9CHLR|nr:M4 family metallopeptidase [Candidatus Promineifilum breve]CUS04715.2 Extracellular metalloprotease [Candidatus Promineifilum breve]